MSYSSIADFGAINDPYSQDPALYCVLDGLDSQFQFGSIGFQKGNRLCSEYMSNRCAANWDELCDAVFQDPAARYPRPQCCPTGLTDGQAMLREAAFKKYLLGTKNCFFACEPFDPTVANSPLVCYNIETAPTSGPEKVAYWTLDGKLIAGCGKGCPVMDNPPCEKTYGFTEKQMRELDHDAVMQRLLQNPNIALDLLRMLASWVHSTGNTGKIAGTCFARFVKANKL